LLSLHEDFQQLTQYFSMAFPFPAPSRLFQTE